MTTRAASRRASLAVVALIAAVVKPSERTAVMGVTGARATSSDLAEPLVTRTRAVTDLLGGGRRELEGCRHLGVVTQVPRVRG